MDLYLKKLYKKDLRRDINSIGLYLFISLLTMFFISIILMFISLTFEADVEDSSINLFNQSISLIVCFFIVGLFYCKITDTSLPEIISFKKNKLTTLVLLVLLGYATTFIANYLSIILDVNLSILGLKTDIDTEFNTSSNLVKLLYILSISIVPALVEEFAFRGIVLGKLRKYGDTFALFMSALLFGMMHGNLVQIPFAFIGGLAFGFITIKANSLLPAMIVHFLNNFVSVILDITISNGILSESILNILYSTLMLCTLILGILAVILLSREKRFFKISNDNDILTFKEKITASFTTAGIILFTIFVIFETYTYITIL